MASLGNLTANDFHWRGRRVLDADELVATALSRSSRREFSDRTFVEPLRRLVDAYNTEAELSAFGRYSVRFDVMRCLKNLLLFDTMEERQPQLLARQIARPIFITGLPRSGTTFLHTLLAQDPSVAAPLSWQLVYPYPPRMRVFGADLRKTWLRCQYDIMKFLSPEMNELHPISPETPQECTDITAQVFQSLRFDSTYRIPSYQNWLDNRGHHDAYRFHKRFLKHLDAQSPGRRWVLKSPDHVFALDAIKAVYPDALIVFMHRDPVSVLASVAKLTEVLRRPFTRRLDRMEIGRQVCSSWVDGAGRMIEAAASSPSILHLHYKQVVSAPMDTVATLYRHCGQNLEPRAERRMRTWLERGSRGANGQSRYSLAEFGLEQGALRELFARYMAKFAVAHEWHPTERRERDIHNPA